MGIFAQLRQRNRENYKEQLSSVHRREARIRLMLTTLRDLDEEHQRRRQQIYREIADIQAGKA